MGWINSESERTGANIITNLDRRIGRIGPIRALAKFETTLRQSIVQFLLSEINELLARQRQLIIGLCIPTNLRRTSAATCAEQIDFDRWIERNCCTIFAKLGEIELNNIITRNN